MGEAAAWEVVYSLGALMYPLKSTTISAGVFHSLKASVLIMQINVCTDQVSLSKWVIQLVCRRSEHMSECSRPLDKSWGWQLFLTDGSESLYCTMMDVLFSLSFLDTSDPPETPVEKQPSIKLLQPMFPLMWAARCSAEFGKPEIQWWRDYSIAKCLDVASQYSPKVVHAQIGTSVCSSLYPLFEMSLSASHMLLWIYRHSSCLE